MEELTKHFFLCCFSNTWSHTNILISVIRTSSQVGAISVTLVLVERMHKNKNGNESYVEACLITFQKQVN